MALQAAVQAGTGQVWDGGLQGVEAVIERQEGVAAEGHDDCLLLGREDGRVRRLGAGSLVIRRGALLPLGDSLLIDAVALGECPQALLTMLYRSTDCRSRTGAVVRALPWRTWTIAHPSIPTRRVHHQTPGSNT